MQETNHHITVKFEDGHKIECAPQTQVKTLAPGKRAPNGLHYLGALVNNEVVSMSYPLDIDCSIRFVTLEDHHGWLIYRNSVAFMLAKTVKELFPAAHFFIEHSLGNAFYCSFELNGRKEITHEELNTIDQRMRETVDRDVPIKRRKVPYTEAVRQFEMEQQWDKYSLLRYSNPPKIVMYVCEGFSDFAHAPIALSTAALPYYRLVRYPPGFVIQFPERWNPSHLPPFEPQPHLFQIFKEHKEWGRILGVNTIGRLNETIAKREIGDVIKITEAFHEKKIARIADHISVHRDRLKWILIAGPSSSGKTTFAKRLAVQLRVNGFKPLTISVDNYFVDRERTPKTETGEYDFENIETIDLELFNRHLKMLDEGAEVGLPYFNFQEGKQEFRGEKLQIKKDEIVIVEGIHCLNPRLTHILPAERKYKIYVSALTQLNLDFHNRISTTDNRLIRRLVRDHRFRGNSALMTLQMWPNVRQGEKKWIFPYQQEANIAFNSALDYELAVLKPHVESLLYEVKPSDPQYAEARRLLGFLSMFLGITADMVPPTSILREFIGKSAFHY
jgi:uridine kinase